MFPFVVVAILDSRMPFALPTRPQTHQGRMRHSLPDGSLAFVPLETDPTRC
jgi:hypothetical protein